MSLSKGLSVHDMTDSTDNGIPDCFKLNERKFLDM
jgi:hypothetical protein